MAQDITLWGNTYTGVKVLDVPKSGGGSAAFLSVDDWSWLGVEPTTSGTSIVTVNTTLASTDYSTWTASTTAHTLISSTSPITFSADMANKSYALRWRWQIEMKYATGVTLKTIPVYQCGEIWQLLFRRPDSLAHIASDSFVGNATVTTRSVPLLKYYKSTGALSYTYSASYGFYCAATAPTFSSSTSNTPTVTVKTPTVSCRCSTTYFDTARKSEIATTTPIKIICLLYEIPSQICAEWQMHKGLVDLYNNPI